MQCEEHTEQYKQTLMKLIRLNNVHTCIPTIQESSWGSAPSIVPVRPYCHVSTSIFKYDGWSLAIWVLLIKAFITSSPIKTSKIVTWGQTFHSCASIMNDTFLVGKPMLCSTTSSPRTVFPLKERCRVLVLDDILWNQATRSSSTEHKSLPCR